MKQQNKVSWGPSSILLLLSFLGSLIPFVEQYADQGSLPTTEALISFGLVVALGILRTVQQVVLDYKDNGVIDDDFIDEDPNVPTDVPPDVVES